MASVESLALLCGSAVNPLVVRGRGGDSGAVGRAEIAGYLAGLSDEAMALAQAKYMADEMARLKLVRFSVDWLRGVVAGGDVGHGGLVLCTLSVREVVAPNRCGKCRGCGFRGAKVCVSCNGSGFKLLSQNGVATAMGVPWTSYRRNWQDLFGRSVARLHDLDAQVNRAVSRSLWRDVCEGDVK